VLLKRIRDARGGKGRYTGVDFVVEDAAAIPGVDYVAARIEELPFPDAAFDTVICTHVIEHVLEYRQAIAELRRVARRRLMIVVPREREYRYSFNPHYARTSAATSSTAKTVREPDPVGALPLPVLAGLVLTPLLISAGQILFKLTSARAGGVDAAGLIGMLLDPYLIAAFAIYGIGTVVWVYVLKSVPLTVAYPFMALTFCAVPLLAWYLLGEALSLRYAVGAALIMAGLVVVNG
jgi:multidrug transporter EmrE-like cation transporter